MVSTDYRVGVDVEMITHKVDKIKHKFLSEEEQWMLMNVPNAPYNIFSEKILTAAWSIKESLFKWQGSSEIDFIKHLPIVKMQINDNSGIAHCKILKEGEIDLKVQLLFFDGNCFSWVLSNVW